MAGSRPARSTRIRPSQRPRGWRSDRPGSTACSAWTCRPAEQQRLLARVGVATEPAPAGTRITVSSEPMPLEVDPAGAETIVATIPSWRRDLAIEADITEEVARVRGYDVVPAILPHTPMPHYRHSPLRLAPHRPRDARRRRPDRGGHLRARVTGDGRAVRAVGRPAGRRRGGGGRSTGHGHEPARRASIRSCARA